MLTAILSLGLHKTPPFLNLKTGSDRENRPDSLFIVQDTGLYYLQNRYYDPAIGRFINADSYVSTGQGTLGNNMFAYCLNNPVKNVDQSGCLGICVLEDPMNLFRAFTTPGMFGSGGGAGGCVAGVSSSYYASQNVKNYDRWWRNSDYNPNMAWSTGAAAQADTATVPQHAWDTLDYIKNNNGAPPNGYKGGRSFGNHEQRLPDDYKPFFEYDVHPKVAGQNRGGERIVVGNGAAWYTNDHYITFTRME